MNFLTTHSTLATICVCSCKHNSNWLASYIHTCTNETHSVAYLQDLNLVDIIIIIIIINVLQYRHTNICYRMKLCRYATECVSFVHVWM